jgi:membrane associated rhomboid family serine protease
VAFRHPSGHGGGPTILGGGLSRPPQDLLALLAFVFITYSMQFFASTALIPALLRLTPAVWQAAFLWQLATYPFAGFGPASLWILLEMLILYWFAGSVRGQLGRRRFWRLLTGCAATAALAAVLVELLARALGGTGALMPFQLMQGQRMLLVLSIAAFATLNRNAVIYLFFVLPIKAAWFIWIQIAIGFVAFLGSKDLAGFAGICAGTAAAVFGLAPGGPWRGLRRTSLTLRQRWLEWRLRTLSRRRRFRVVDDDRWPGGHGPVN